MVTFFWPRKRQVTALPGAHPGQRRWRHDSFKNESTHKANYKLLPRYSAMFPRLLFLKLLWPLNARYKSRKPKPEGEIDHIYLTMLERHDSASTYWQVSRKSRHSHHVDPRPWLITYAHLYKLLPQRQRFCRSSSHPTDTEKRKRLARSLGVVCWRLPS